MIVLFITFKLKKLIIVVAAVLIAIIAILLLIGGANENDATETYALASTVQSKLVIDPGHGGIDGGAVSAAGAKESDINLAIADKMCGIADFLGLEYVRTRNGDDDTSEAEAYSEHENLVARAQLVNSTENAVLISVHQNEYPSEAVCGAEVMYADTLGSKELAESMQTLLVTQLDPENRRVSRPAPKELLLTRSINCPGVLVECGFLSNPMEAQKLDSDEYQLKIAAVLMAAYANFSGTYYKI